MSERIQKREITEEMQTSYLDYAMSVIISRALPDVRDGFKPVHRRILYAMYEMGLRHNIKFTKCANIVGSVLGRYHPHGDIAVYDSLVRMAQDFSLRYPLIEGQGNFGSIDGDGAAAYRYTEARLTKLAEEMLKDIEKDTVKFNDNYDGTRKEPAVLPALLPNLLLNGTVGIAVGMATSIPPHNLTEVTSAAIHLIDNPKAGNEDLLQYITGPDFPTGGIIYDKKSILEAYATGRGKVTIRAVAEIGERKNKEFQIVVTEIPYQVNKAELITHMAELVTEKKLDGIRDIRDESDKEGLRVVIELKNTANPQRVLNQLYNRTDLQKDFHFNLLALSDGIQPQILSLKNILELHLKHRNEVIRRRSQFDLKKTQERVHILFGLARALKHIDAVIRAIKKSESKEDAHKNLVRQFKLTAAQADAILEMRLQTLAGLERKKIETELKEKQALAAQLESILKNPKKILKLIKDDLLYLKDAYGDERRTKIISSALKEFKEEDLVPQEKAIITLTQGGYIKRMPPATVKSQRRGGKGVIGFEVKEEDFVSHFLHANTHDNILFFTDRGRAFQTKVYEIPEGSRTSQGKAIHNFLEVPVDEKIKALVAYPSVHAPGGGATTDGQRSKVSYLVMATAGGMIKKTPLEEFMSVRRSGIIAIRLKKGDELRWARLSSGEDDIILVGDDGQAIRFPEKQTRPMGRTAAGVTGMRLKTGAKVSALDIVSRHTASTNLLVVTQNGFGKQTPLKEYRRQSRGGRGIKTAKVTPKTGRVVCAEIIVEQKELITLSEKGQIMKTDIASIRTMGRATQGVKIMNLQKKDAIAGVISI
ncbi:MAG: DNA gyrase subunit A [Parcubacteria group bacterium RIFCSPLOWO2_01_FULL_48_18]|nr:MAG: DNA gyrase subunit A [Parcubacteria group bacterium RIFCSPHIGHO2_02_FULL_48_10b]OHB22378.1 MAG: DNA gyrase subunit A [Parcubacteria group bacterium RIFCSPLOWO2_01_FULL_48_18]